MGGHEKPGRPLKGAVKTVPKKVNLEPQQWELLRKLAHGGSYSDGIRVLLEGLENVSGPVGWSDGKWERIA
jgi:hypothetical protein